MRSGRKKDKVSFYTIDRNSQDKYGNPDDTPILFWETKANVQVLSVNDTISNGLEVNSESISILCRLNVELKHDMEVIWSGNHYDVVGIKPTENRIDMVVTAQRLFT